MLDYGAAQSPPALPRNGPGMQTAAAPAPGPSAWSVFELIAILWSGRFIIVAGALLGAFLMLAVGKSLPPSFAATAQLYIDPRDLRVLESELTPRTDDPNTGIALIESQMLVITSSNVLRRVVDAEDLAADPDFGGKEEDGDSGAAVLRAMSELEGAITTSRPERTYIIEITVKAKDADKAARLANAVVEAYLAEETASRAEAARRTTVALTRRLDELREQVRSAEERIERFKARNNLIGVRGQLVTEQQLSEANLRVAQARGVVDAAEARLAAVLANRGAANRAENVPEGFQSATIADLRRQYAVVRRRMAELGAVLQPSHPEYERIAAQERDLRTLIEDEIDRVVQEARNMLAEARGREAAAEGELEELKARSIGDGEAFVTLREMEREAAVSRDLYGSFLARSRETSEQEQLDTANTRLITTATPPKYRSFPPRMALLMMAGFIFGGGGGTGCVLGNALLRAAPRMPRHQPLPGNASADGASPDAPMLGAPAVAHEEVCGLPMIGELTMPKHSSRLASAQLNGGTVNFGNTGLSTPELTADKTFLRSLASIRAQLMTLRRPGRMHCLAIVGLPGSRAHTELAVNLARAGAAEQENVILIDSDWTGRGLTTTVDTAPDLGLQYGPSGYELDYKGLVRWTTDDFALVLAPQGVLSIDRPDPVQLVWPILRDGARCDQVVLDGPCFPIGPTDCHFLSTADDIVIAISAGENTDDIGRYMPGLKPFASLLRGVIRVTGGA